MIWSASSHAWAYLQLASSAEYLRLREAQQVCVCVRLCAKRVEPSDYTTCASLCQQLNVCRALFLFGTWSAVSLCVTADVVLIIHHVLLKTDNLRASDLPTGEYSMTVQKERERKSWVVITQCSSFFLIINELLKFPFLWMSSERDKSVCGYFKGERQFDNGRVICIPHCWAALA